MISLACLWMMIGFLTIALVPCVCGIFRLQMHRCPRCLNEYKEESIFSSLDDNIIDMQVGTYFGILVKRRSLVKALVLALTCFFLFYLYQAHNDTPTWLVEHTGNVDKLLTWDAF